MKNKKNPLAMAMKFHGDSLIGMLALEFLFGLFGIGISLLIYYLDNAEAEWLSGSSLMAVFGVAFLTVFSAVSYRQEFIRALSMSRTRKEFMLGYAFRMVLQLALGYVLVLAFYAVDQYFFLRVLSLPKSAEITHFWIDWEFALIMIPCVTILTMFLGALIDRFGRKIMMILYFPFIALCSSTGRITDLLEAATAGNGPLAWVMAIPAAVWIGLGIAALAAMVYGILRMGMKQMVQ